MNFRIIKSPSRGTLDILEHRLGAGSRRRLEHVEAVGLVQGKLIEMIVAADIAEKTAGVTVEDIRGSCPQNMILLAVFGDTSSVESAMERIRESIKEAGK